MLHPSTYPSFPVVHSLVARAHPLRIHLVLAVLADVVQVDEVRVSVQVLELHVLGWEKPAVLDFRVCELAGLAVVFSFLLVGEELSHSVQ